MRQVYVILSLQQAELSSIEQSSPAAGGLQHHKRQTASLQKQIKQQSAMLQQVTTKEKLKWGIVWHSFGDD